MLPGVRTPGFFVFRDEKKRGTNGQMQGLKQYGIKEGSCYAVCELLMYLYVLLLRSRFKYLIILDETFVEYRELKWEGGCYHEEYSIHIFDYTVTCWCFDGGSSPDVICGRECLKTNMDSTDLAMRSST